MLREGVFLDLCDKGALLVPAVSLASLLDSGTPK